MLRRLVGIAIAIAALVFVAGTPPGLAADNCQAGMTTVQTNWGVICVVAADPGSPATPG
jgi:hypothetical protein